MRWDIKMFDYLAGYSLSRFRAVVAAGNLNKIQSFIHYYKVQNRLDYILHSYRGAGVINAPSDFWGSNLLFDAFRIKEKPQYEAALMLLNAGTRPSHIDDFKRNIYHFILERGDINFFRFMLFYDQTDFEEVLKFTYGSIPITLDNRLNEWDRLKPGRRDIVINTANDAKFIRTKLAEASIAHTDKVAECYFKIAKLYLKHADYENLPEYRGLALFRQQYLIKAYAAFQHANEAYEKLAGLSSEQNAKLMETLIHLIGIAKELGNKEDELLYSARISLCEGSFRHSPAAQAPFLRAETNSIVSRITGPAIDASKI